MFSSVRIWSYSGPHFPTFGPNRKRCGVSIRIRSKCGKMRTRITPNTVLFHAVQLSQKKKKNQATPTTTTTTTTTIKRSKTIQDKIVISKLILCVCGFIFKVLQSFSCSLLYQISETKDVFLIIQHDIFCNYYQHVQESWRRDTYQRFFSIDIISTLIVTPKKSISSFPF